MYEIYGYPYGNPDAELLIYQPGNKKRHGPQPETDPRSQQRREPDLHYDP